MTAATEQKMRSLKVVRVREQARDTRSFDMLPEGSDQGLVFKPGQVAVLRAGVERPAYFAFASAPEDREVEFLIKRGGGASGLIYEMAEGSQVELVNVVGNGFALAEQKGKDL